MQTIQLASTQHHAVIERAVAVLKAGGLMIFPTETTYGAGVDATNPAAVEKLLAYKARREGKPLSIAVTSQEMAERFVELTEQARALYKQFLPGPVTVISRALPQNESRIAPGVISEFGTLGVRIPAYPLVTEIVAALGSPITATSANVSDQKRPYAVSDIFERISAKQAGLIDLVLDAGTLPPNPPSTVIDTTLSTPMTLREGTLSQTTESSPLTTLSSASPDETKQIAGRLMLKHWNDLRATGLIIGLEGSLGMGKTIFAKGVAEFLQISEEITSPTYSYMEEYDFTRHQTTGKFYHLDLWKIDSAEQLERLELEQILQPNTVVVIEWFNQFRAWLEPLILAKQTATLVVTFDQPNPQANERKLSITE